MAKKKREQYQFRPDPTGTNVFKKLHLTDLQRRMLLKWGLLSVLNIALLVLQDVTMSQFRFSGATTDLAVCGIFLIGLYEGIEDGGVFALLASVFYYFSGSAPGPYVIFYITGLTVLLNLLRQSYWRRSFSSISLCGCMGIMAYEVLIYLTALVTELTVGTRFGVAVLTGALTCVVFLPLYHLVARISLIGGEAWKE